LRDFSFSLLEGVCLGVVFVEVIRDEEDLVGNPAPRGATGATITSIGSARGASPRKSKSAGLRGLFMDHSGGSFEVRASAISGHGLTEMSVAR
jgi:hypothetical protein